MKQYTVIRANYKSGVMPASSFAYFHKYCFEEQKSFYRQHYINFRVIGVGLVKGDTCCFSCGISLRDGENER